MNNFFLLLIIMTSSLTSIGQTAEANTSQGSKTFHLTSITFTESNDVGSLIDNHDMDDETTVELTANWVIISYSDGKKVIINNQRVLEMEVE